MGPEMETAAITRPEGPRTGADTYSISLDGTRREVPLTRARSLAREPNLVTGGRPRQSARTGV